MSEARTETQASIRAKLVYYVSGELVTVRQDFPTTREELAANLADAGVEAGQHAEFLDSVCETSVYALDYNLPRKPGLDELNELAHRLSHMTENDLQTMGCVIEAGFHHGSLAEFINLTHNLGEFDFYPGQFSKTEFGGIMLEMHAGQHWESRERLRTSNDPDDRAFADYVERLEQGLDLGKYGELARAADGGILTRSGYLIPLAAELPQKYTGPRDIPAEHRITGAPEAAERKPSLLSAVAAFQESQARQDAQERPGPSIAAPSGPEL